MAGPQIPHPARTLMTVFLAWKAFLLVVAAGTRVSTSYDTSSSLLPSGPLSQSQPLLVTRLTSWDALYFVQIARQGYRFEQEWAFGYGFPSVIRLWKAAASLIWDRDLLSEAVLGIGVAHLSHLLSVLVLYRLGISVWRDRQLAFVAAGLHIVSPAGIFLSAPYAESTFALLSFAGYFFYVKGCRAPEPTLRSDAWQLLAAVFFGVATIFRSNGIINGIPFACEAAQELVRFLKRPERTALRRLVFLGVGGLCVAAGSVGPQLVAYQRYCSGLPAAANPRPWCTRLVPSIYTYVQELYWGVGFFNYWELNQIPMFVLAAPMTLVLIKTGVDTLREGPRSTTDTTVSGPQPRGDRLTTLLHAIAASQVILAVLAVTNYHVQIITRLASAYPVWYWWIARSLAGQPRSKIASGVVIFMVMYASIQAALFAFFLPPA